MSFGDGVSCSVRELFLEGQKSLGFDLHFKKSQSYMVGDKRSKVRGRGMDFFESRPYVAQDEIKNIDWKVSARLNELFTKIYTEEKDRPVYLLIDLRSSMFFGSINCFKSVLAARIAARLAVAGINGGDHVGGLVFNDQEETECRIRGGRKNLARLFGLIANATQSKPSPSSAFMWQSVLKKAAHQHSGSMVLMISDFSGLLPSHKPWLYQLKKRSDVLAIKVFDPLEKDLPSLGEVAMFYGDQEIAFDSSNKILAKRFFKERVESDKGLAQIFSSLGIPMMEFSTALDPTLLLKKIFSGRW